MQSAKKHKNIIAFDDYCRPVVGSPKWLHKTITEHVSSITDYLNKSTPKERFSFAINILKAAHYLALMALIANVTKLPKMEAARYDSLPE